MKIEDYKYQVHVFLYNHITKDYNLCDILDVKKPQNIHELAIKYPRASIFEYYVYGERYFWSRRSGREWEFGHL